MSAWPCPRCVDTGYAGASSLRAAEGGTGRRPHARPEAVPPSAQPAALTQYRNSSPRPPCHPRVPRVTSPLGQLGP